MFRAFIVCISLIVQVYGICPIEKSISAPCDCNEDVLSCIGPQINDEVLESVIQSLNSHLNETEKNFSTIRLQNTDLIDLKENVFKELTFDSIEMIANYELEIIDRNAFNGTNFKTKSIKLWFLPGLKQSPQSFFDVLSKLVNLETIDIQHGLNITEIPSNAFKPLNGPQNHLKRIDFGQTVITKIGTRAFYYLNSLEVLHLFMNEQMALISDYAFEFENKSTQTIKIDFDKNHAIEPESFDINSLISIQRPTTIYLSYKYPGQEYFHYLDERVFLPFMLADPHNLLKFDIWIDCNDCRNAWLKAYESTLNHKWTCHSSNKINFDDQSTFSQCKK